MQKHDAPLVSVPAGEFQRHIGRYQVLALTQPVAATRNGRERTVMIPPRSTTGSSVVTAR